MRASEAVVFTVLNDRNRDGERTGSLPGGVETAVGAAVVDDEHLRKEPLRLTERRDAVQDARDLLFAVVHRDENQNFIHVSPP